MKFLVLVLCVSAASAASFGSVGQRPFQQQTVAKAFVETAALPAAVPVAAITAAKAAFQSVPVSGAKAVYDAGSDATAAVLRSESNVEPNGFNYFFETSNGIAAQASGVTKRVENKDIVVVQGSFKHVDANGKEEVITYVADENGYQPQGNILPVGPAIPEAIQRSLAYIAANYKPE